MNAAPATLLHAGSVRRTGEGGGKVAAIAKFHNLSKSLDRTRASATALLRPGYRLVRFTDGLLRPTVNCLQFGTGQLRYRSLLRQPRRHLSSRLALPPRGRQAWIMTVHRATTSFRAVWRPVSAHRVQ